MKQLHNAKGEHIGVLHPSGRVVLDGPQPHPNMSASSYDTFNDCARKWWYAKVARVVQPSSAALDTGIAVHDMLERYLKTGEKPPADDKYGRIALPGIEHAPAPGTVSVEEWVSGQCGPLRFLGKVDFFHRPSDDLLVVGDWKTSSDPGRWGKTPEQLSKHHQMLGYAYLLGEDSPPTTLSLTHIYLRTRGAPLSYPVTATTGWDAATSTWATYLNAAEQMARLADLTDSEQVPINTQACRKYGGCPFANACTQTMKQGNGKMNDAQQRLRARLRGTPAQPINPPTAAPEANPTDALVATVADSFKLLAGQLREQFTEDMALNVMARNGLDPAKMNEALRAAGLAVFTPDPEPTPAAVAPADNDDDEDTVDDDAKIQTTVEALTAALAARGGPMPAVAYRQIIKDAMGMQRLRQPRIDAVIEAGEAAGAFTLEGQSLVRLGTVAPMPKMATVPAAQITSASLCAEDYVKVAEATAESEPVAPEPTQVVEAEPTPEPPPEPVVPPAAPAAQEDNLLLVDCLFDGVQCASITDLLTEVETELEAEKDTPYIYGERFRDGQKAVAARLAYRIAEGALSFEGTWTIDSTHVAYQEVMPLLRRHFKRIIRAAR